MSVSSTKEMICIMAAKLEIAEVHDRNQRNTTYDGFCEKVITDKQTVAWMIKECVEEFKDIVIEDIIHRIVSEPILDVSRDETADLPFEMEDYSISGAVILYDISLGVIFPDSEKAENINLLLYAVEQISCNESYPIVCHAIHYVGRYTEKWKQRKGNCIASNCLFPKRVYPTWIVIESNKMMHGLYKHYTIEKEYSKTKYGILKEDDRLSIKIMCLNDPYDHNDKNHDLMEIFYILFAAALTSEAKKRLLEQKYGITMVNREQEASKV